MKVSIAKFIHAVNSGNLEVAPSGAEGCSFGGGSGNFVAFSFPFVGELVSGFFIPIAPH